MICRNCHKNIPSDSEICPECGVRIKKHEGAGYKAASNAYTERPSDESEKQGRASSVFDTPIATKKVKRSMKLPVLITIIVMVIAITSVSVIIATVARGKKMKDNSINIDEYLESYDLEDLDFGEFWSLIEDLQDEFPEDTQKIQDLIQEYMKENYEKMDEDISNAPGIDEEFMNDFLDNMEQYWSDAPEEYKEYFDQFRKQWSDPGQVDTQEMFDIISEMMKKQQSR